MLDWFLRFVGHQHWIRYSIRTRVLIKFRDPATIESKKFEINFFGLKYKGNLNNYLDWYVFYYGAYERKYLFFLKSLVKNVKKPIFVDVGANLGQHSLFMSNICNVVHSFEPNPEVRKRLETSIEINNIVIHNVGLGVQNEDMPYFAPRGRNKGTGSFVEGFSSNNEEKSILLRVVNGDKYFSNLNIDKIDLVKIDIEGFEKFALAGLQKTIVRYRPNITMEYSSATRNSFLNRDELMKLLPPDYQIHKIVCDKPCGVFFNGLHCVLEEFNFDVTRGDILLSPAV